jgi:ribosomal-protein-alanine N-acetyltransferase
MLAMPVLESERLVLRQFCRDDLTDVVSWERVSDEKRSHEAQAFLDFCFQSYRRWGMGPWGMLHREDQKIVGSCGFCRIDFRTNIGEVSYYLAGRYRKQGMATEALQVVIRFGFQDLSLAETRATCTLDNKSSERVMQKAGMQFVRIINSKIAEDRTGREKLYAITRR